MARVINTSLYKYNGAQTRQRNNVNETEKTAVQKLNVIQSGLAEKLMDYWFFDYAGYHGSNPNGLGQADTPFTVGSTDPINVFTPWSATGSPLVKQNSVVCDNSVGDESYAYVDFIVTCKPMIWNDIYGKVGEKILFNIVNLPYMVANPLYKSNPSTPDFVGNKELIPNARGFLVEYYKNLLKLSTTTEFGYTTYAITNEYSVNAGFETEEASAQTYTSKRIRNKLVPLFMTNDEKNLFLSIIYGIMPISIVANAHN